MAGGPRDVEVLFVGGGPAGTGPLVHAAATGRLDGFLERGIALVEAGPGLCAGSLGRYAIRSNSAASSFIECLEHPRSGGVFARSRTSAAYRQLCQTRWETADLALVADMLRSIGADLEGALRGHGNTCLHFRSEVTSIALSGDGGCLATVDTPGGMRQIRAKKVVLAPGGLPRTDEILRRHVVADVESAGGVVEFVDSDDLLTGRHLPALARYLQNDDPHVVVIGGSHSGFSSASMLHPFARTMDIVHRGAIRVFYPSVEEARADGYVAFGTDDVCPETGRLFRIAGLRGHARDLYRKIASGGVGDRIRLVQSAREGGLPGLEWRKTNLVVFALGYRFRHPRMLGPSGDPLALAGDADGRYVDQRARLLDADRKPIPGMYAIGMATGFIPAGKLGGEPSFSGRDNSVWLCQHLLGQMVFEQLMDRDVP